MLEIEKALYEVKKFSKLENKISFLINKSREEQLELASGEEVYNKLKGEGDPFQDPHNKELFEKYYERFVKFK